jgi:hypothetical protein
MRAREIADVLQTERLKRARPWTPVSTDQLTARELLSLIGIEGKGRRYRRVLRYLRLACNRDDGAGRSPHYLNGCFREGVRVYVFQGRGHGAVSLEYRIPVESLDDKYVEHAKKLISARNGRASDSICVSREAFKELVALSARAGRSISEMIEQWVHREWKFWLENGEIVPSTREADRSGPMSGS